MGYQIIKQPNWNLYCIYSTKDDKVIKTNLRHKQVVDYFLEGASGRMTSIISLIVSETIQRIRDGEIVYGANHKDWIIVKNKLADGLTFFDLPNLDKVSNNFYVGDQYYDDFDYWIEELEGEFIDRAENVKGVVGLEVVNGQPQPRCEIGEDNIDEMLLRYFEDRGSEDGDEWHKVTEVIKEVFNREFCKNFNSRMPTMYMATGEKITIPISEIKEYISIFGTS